MALVNERSGTQKVAASSRSRIVHWANQMRMISSATSIARRSPAHPMRGEAIGGDGTANLHRARRLSTALRQILYHDRRLRFAE